MGFCFLCFCFLLRGNSTASFIFSSLKHEAISRGPPVAPDVHQAGRRTDVPVFFCNPSLIPFSVPSSPWSSGEATLWSRRGLPGVEKGPWTWPHGLHLAVAPKLHRLLQVTAHPCLSFGSSTHWGEAEPPSPALLLAPGGSMGGGAYTGAQRAVSPYKVS